MSGSRIAVEILGQSAELQKAAAAGGRALTELGDVLKRQTDMALRLGDQTLKSNAALSRSYQMAAREAGLASDRTVAAFERQGAVVLGSARKQTAALDETATAAKRSSSTQVKASGEAAAASERAANTQVRSARRAEQAFGSASSGLTKSGKTISLGLLGAAAASVDLAVKFQSNTLRIQTQAGATAKQLDLIRKGLLKMAPAVGYTPNALADGMYHVVSSMTAAQRATYGVTGQLKVMTTAAKLAQVGHSNLEDTTYALVSALQALHEPLSKVGTLAAQVNAIVGSGDMTMTDFVEALKSGLLPAAKTAGLSLQSIGSAMAAMGDQGMRGSLAGTRLRMSIALLSSPSAAAAKVLDTLGLSSREATSRSEAMSKALEKAGLRTTALSADLRKPDGISVALRDLRDHLEKAGLTATGAAAVMNKAFGGGRMGATITLLANNLGQVDSKFHQIGDSANKFGADWTKTTQTTSFQLHRMEGNLAAVGTRIGTDLLPAANTAIHDLSVFVGWLEKGSTSAHAFEVGLGAIATVAVGSLFVSQIKKAISLIKDFKSAATFIAGGRPGVAGVTGSAGPALPGGAGAMGMISGARGFTAPGSIANPIVVAMEAGEYAGLSSMGASGTVGTEQKVAQAESGAVNAASRDSGLILPAGVKSTGVTGGVGSAEAAAATAGIVSAERKTATSIMGSVKGALSGVMRGGLLAAGGTAASQLAGHVIGGSAGRAVSDVGTGASIGAGAGSLAGPEGTIIGGIGGAIIGGLVDLFHSASFGQKASSAIFSHGFGGSKAPELSKQVSTALDQLRKYTTGTKTTIGARGSRMEVPIQLDFSKLSPEQQAKAMAAAHTAGTLVAKQLEAGWDQYRFQSEPIMFAQLRSKLKSLPPQAQASAVASAVQFAEGLQKQGRLPAGAAAHMLTQIERQFPAFEQYMGLAAGDGIKQFNAALDFSATEKKVNAQLHSISQDFPQVQQAMSATTQTVQAKSQAAVTALQQIVEKGTAPMRAQAQHDLDQLRQTTDTDLQAMASTVTSKTQEMAGAIEQGSQQAAQTAYTNLSNFASNVTQAMSDGTLATGKGMALIIETLNKALKEMGQKQLSPIQVGAMSISIGKQAQLQRAGADTGGWVGNPGEKGRDMVPAVLGRGEAVLNHQQQAIVNRALSATGIGSLSNVFAGTAGSRHYMASGGYAGGALSYSQLEGLWEAGGGPKDVASLAAAIALAESSGRDVMQQGQPFATTGWGYWQITPGGPQYLDPMTNARAAVAKYRGAGDTFRPWTTFNDGAYRQFLHGNVAASLAGIGAAGSIGVPKVTGTGAIADIVKGAVTLAAKAANSFLGAQSSTAAAGGGAFSTAGLPSGGGFSPGQLATFDGLQVAKWIIPELAWARQRGWAGHVTSGWRSPSQVVHGVFATAPQGQSEHQYDIYPGGAVDVSDYQQFAQIIGGYPGADKLIQLGIDPLHFSGTGHAAGGIIRGFAGGGTAGNMTSALRRAPVIKPPHATKPKVKSPKQTKAAKLPKLPNLKTLPGFDQTLLNQISGADTSATELGNWLGYLQGLYGAVVTQATLTDANGNETINWGSSAGALGQLTGMIDPTTGQVTKSIWDRLREIGDPGANPDATATRDRMTELGANEQILDALLNEQGLAGRALGEFGPWLANMNASVGFEQAAIGWLGHTLNPQAPWDDISQHDLAKILTGSVKMLRTFPKGAPSGSAMMTFAGDRFMTVGLAKYVVEKAREYKNTAAQLERWNERKQQLPGEQAARDQAITTRFAAARTRLQVSSAKSTFDGGQLLRDQELALEQEKRSALAGMTSAKPRGWKGDPQAWAVEHKRERGAVDDEFAARKAALETHAASAGLSGRISRIKALAALSAEESAEKFSVRGAFGQQKISLDKLIKGDTSTQGGDRKYLSGILAQIKALDTKDTASLTAATSSGGFRDQLNAYVDPMGSLSISIDTKKNIDIAGLLREIGELNGTTVTASAAGGSATDSQLASLLQQENLILSETLALNEAQTSVLAGMIPEIPSYDKGGPIIGDQLAQLHDEEYVVPRGGALVKSGGGGPTTVELHQHNHGSAAALMSLIDQRIQHPDNVRVISRTIGQRTSMLSNRPGRF